MEKTTIPFAELSLSGDDFENARSKSGLKKGEIKELAKTIANDGLLNPLIVWGEDNVILAGQRRYKAIEHLINEGEAGDLEDAVPVHVCEAETLADAMVVSVLDNVAREDLSKYEEMVAYEQLLESGLNQTQVAERTGRSKSYVSRSLGAWNKAGKSLKKALRDDKIPFDTFKDLAGYETDKAQEEAMADYLAETGSGTRKEKGKARQKAKAKAGKAAPKSKKQDIQVQPVGEMRNLLKFFEETEPSNAWERGYAAAVQYVCNSVDSFDPADETAFERFSAKYMEFFAPEDEEEAAE